MNAFQLGIVNNIKREQPIVEGDFLAFSSDSPFSIKFNQKSWDGVLEYSTDTTNWIEWDASEISSVNNTLYLRGSGNSIITGIGAIEDPESYAMQISASDGVECSGNIMSLLDHTSPDTVLMSEACFSGMFLGTNLTAAPELPASTLAPDCYSLMFSDCTYLTAAPELPAMTLADYCYYGMFSGCTSLTIAPELPAMTLSDGCYYNMFSDCTSLTTVAPELPAMTLARNCYNNMFDGCTSLTTAPELPAMALADYCYYGMFGECTSLTTAPELPAMTLAVTCYFAMFYGCTSLTTAPDLPATTLADTCYTLMFYGCTNVKISETQTGIYQKPWRIPTEGTISNHPFDWEEGMLEGTGGTFTGDPTTTTTYYQAGGEVIDPNDPNPDTETDDNSFSYEIEVGQFIAPDGMFTLYGADETMPMGEFINKNVNDTIGNLRSIVWANQQGSSPFLGVVAENSDYLLTSNDNLDITFRDQNGEILNLTISPQYISETPSGEVVIQIPLTEEQFNILPTSGRVFVDITLGTSGEVSVPVTDTHFFTPGIIPDIAYGYISVNGTKIKSYAGGFGQKGHIFPNRTKNGFTINALIYGYYNGVHLYPDIYIEIIDNSKIERPESITLNLPTIGNVNLEYLGKEDGKNFYGHTFLDREDSYPYGDLFSDLDGFEIKIVENGGGVVTDPDSNPDPSFSTFSYEFEVGGHSDLGGEFAIYGVDEMNLPTIGAFINNIENNEIGNLRAIVWGYNHDNGHFVGVMAENSNYLLTYNNNLELTVRDQNGEILSVTISPEYIDTQDDLVFIIFPLTEEQFNLLPKNGVVSVDIGLYAGGEVTAEGDLYSYEIGVAQSPNPDYYGTAIESTYSDPFGTLIEHTENDELGVYEITWGGSEGEGYGIDVSSSAIGYFETYYYENPNINIGLTVRDQNGEILSVTMTRESFYWVAHTGDLATATRLNFPLTEEQFNLLPKSGSVFVDIVL